MASVNKPILLDETGKDMAAAIREQTEILSRATITMNPADYIVDCEYVEGEVTFPSGETITAVTSWYERYASGKVRQGGAFTGVVDELGYGEIVLNVPMKDNLYKAGISAPWFNAVESQEIVTVGAVDASPTSFWGLAITMISGSIPAPWVWTVEGKGAEL